MCGGSLGRGGGRFPRVPCESSYLSAVSCPDSYTIGQTWKWFLAWLDGDFMISPLPLTPLITALTTRVYFSSGFYFYPPRVGLSWKPMRFCFLTSSVCMSREA